MLTTALGTVSKPLVATVGAVGRGTLCFRRGTLRMTRNGADSLLTSQRELCPVLRRFHGAGESADLPIERHSGRVDTLLGEREERCEFRQFLIWEFRGRGLHLVTLVWGPYDPPGRDGKHAGQSSCLGLLRYVQVWQGGARSGRANADLMLTFLMGRQVPVRRAWLWRR